MKRLHWPLVSIALMFLAPLIAAAITLQFSHKLNLPTKQHGAFIQPQQVDLINIAYIAGSDHVNKWQIVYIAPETCDENCLNEKRILHNLHVALGAQRDRVAIISAQVTADIEHAPKDLIILNPQGLYIMRYNNLDQHTGLLKDIRRLLKYSHG